MVWDSASLFDWYFGRGNLNALVNLNGITVDYFPAETDGQLDSERALPGSSRPNDGDDWGADIMPAFFRSLLV